MKKKIASILKHYRKINHLSPDDVSVQLKKYGIDVAPKTLYGYEVAKSNVTADTFLCLCRIYNISSFDIFFDEETTIEIKTPYDLLNKYGKEKADEYIDDLIGNPKYIEKDKYSQTEDISKQFQIAAANGEVMQDPDDEFETTL